MITQPQQALWALDAAAPALVRAPKPLIMRLLSAWRRAAGWKPAPTVK